MRNATDDIKIRAVRRLVVCPFLRIVSWFAFSHSHSSLSHLRYVDPAIVASAVAVIAKLPDDFGEILLQFLDARSFEEKNARSLALGKS